MISSSAVYSTVFSKGSVTGCDSLLGVGWTIFHFRLFKSFCFLLIEYNHIFFSISYIVLTCYVYYYCVLLGFNTLFSCFFAGFILFSPKGSVTGCDSSLGSFCHSPVYFLLRMHLHSGYYYYDNVVVGVLRPLMVFRNSLLNRLTAVKAVKQLKIIIMVDESVFDMVLMNYLLLSRRMCGRLLDVNVRGREGGGMFDNFLVKQDKVVRGWRRV